MSLKILYASDEGYAPHLATSIYSLLRHNSDLICKIYVFTSNMSNRSASRINDICINEGVKVSFVYLDDHCFEDLALGNHFQKSNYYRLFAADYIDADKCLYIDADTLVLASLKGLLKFKMSDEFYLAAVEECGTFNRHLDLKMCPEARYFNSGVMLINLNSWRKNNVKESVVNFVRTFPDSIKFVDQCGLNSVVNGRWLHLSKTYNFQTAFIETEIQLPSESPAIIHFTGSMKPWHIRSAHPFKRQYWNFRNKTVFKRPVADDFSVVAVCKLLAVFLRRSFSSVLSRFLC